MEFKTNLWRVINRDGKIYAADDKWIIDLPEKLGKAYKFESLKAPKKVAK